MTTEGTVYYAAEQPMGPGIGINAMGTSGLVRKVGYSQAPTANIMAGIGIKCDSAGNVYYLMQFIDPDGGDTSPLYKFNRIGEFTFSTITNVPILLNTSFNIKGEPIVCSPSDAIRTFYTSGLDVLIINDFYIAK